MKRKFLVEIDCEDKNAVLYEEGLQIAVEDYMNGFKETCNISNSDVNVTELK